MRHASVAFGLLCACGSVKDKPDAAMHDVNTIDTPSAMIDATPMGTGMKHRYVVSQELVPQNNTQARDFGLDLNNDGTVDNQLGMVLATFTSQGTTTGSQATVDTAIAQGLAIILPELQATDFTTAAGAGFTIYQGSNPQPPACNGSTDLVCGHHLTGSGSFAVGSTTLHDAPLVGSISNGTLSTPAGGAHLPLILPLGGPQPLVVDMVGARAVVTAASATGLTAVIGGGITQADIDNKVIPTLQVAEVAIVARDCPGATAADAPGCKCVAGSPGKTAIGLFDTMPSDCTITVAEIKNNNLFSSLLAPDLMIGGVPALSIGVKLTAVGASFTP